DDTFAQSHLAQGVAIQSAGVTNARIDGDPVHHAVAESHIPLLVLSDAAHPAMDAIIGSVRPLLIDGVSAAGPPDLIPARASDAGQCLYRLVRHQRFVCAKVAVAKTEGRPLPV